MRIWRNEKLHMGGKNSDTITALQKSLGVPQKGIHRVIT